MKLKELRARTRAEIAKAVSDLDQLQASWVAFRAQVRATSPDMGDEGAFAMWTVQITDHGYSYRSALATLAVAIWEREQR